MSISPSAADLARRLLRPGVLDETLRSGLFLLQEPASVSWVQFAQALAGELEALGALVLQLDLADAGLAPVDSLRQVLCTGLSGLAVSSRLLESDVFINFGGWTISSLIEELIGRSGKDLVLICNQVSRLAGPAEGQYASGQVILKRPEAAARIVST